jgi:hypothetical protein
MVQFDGEFNGKVLVPDEPLNETPGKRFRVTLTPLDGDLAAAADDAETIEDKKHAIRAAWDGENEFELARALARVDPLPPDFVRRPGSAKGEFEVPDDFKDIPEEFKDYI